MDPLSLALMGGSVASSLIGLLAQGEGGQKYIDQAIKELISVKIPDPEQQKIALQRFYSTGQLDPELEREIKGDPSAFETVVKNQRYAQAQDRALGELQSIGEEGGMRLSDKAALQGELMESANKDRANRDAIMDEMARRGQGGSGMALQAQLAGAQSAGDRDAMSRLSALGGAQDRALKAIMGAGDLAGTLQDQDYQMKSDQATARDRINQFNTENARSVQQRNVAGQNAAQEYNLSRSQDIADRNVNLSNEEQQYNKSIDQQRYENEMGKAKSMADVYGQAANQAEQKKASDRQSWGAIGSGLGQMGSSFQDQANFDKYQTLKKPSIQGQTMTDWDDWMKRAKQKYV